MQLFIWIGLSVVISVVAIRRPFLLIAIGIALYLFVPYVAGYLVGGNNAPHPASTLALIGLIIQLLFNGKAVGRELKQLGGTYLLLGAIMIAVLAFIVLQTGTLNLNSVIDQMVAPIAFFVLFRMGAATDVRFTRWVINFILVCATVQVGLAVVTWLNGGPLFYLDQYAIQYWFSLTLTRGMGTLDNPLVLTLFLACCVPLLAVVRSSVIQLSLLLIFLVGIFLTQGRTGLVAAMIGAAFLVARPGARLASRISIVVAILVSGVVVLAGTVADGVFERFTDDGGSASARGKAVSAFFSRLGDFVFFGGGLNGDTNFSASEGLRTSLESAGMIYTVRFGLIFTLAYFGIQLYLILRKRRAPHVPGARLAAFFALVLVQTFSSLATVSASAMLLWTFVGIASITLTAGDSDEKKPLDAVGLDNVHPNQLQPRFQPRERRTT